MDRNRPGLVYYRPKKSSNWPLGVILGVFAVGIVAFLAALSGKSPRNAAGPGTGPADREGYADCMALRRGYCYSLSAQTPLCATGGGPVSEADAVKQINLPAGAQIGILAVKDVAGVPWYQVQAVAPDGLTPLGAGWVSATSLKGQYLRLLR